jgi:hypothetical protein
MTGDAEPLDSMRTEAEACLLWEVAGVDARLRRPPGPACAT